MNSKFPIALLIQFIFLTPEFVYSDPLEHELNMMDSASLDTELPDWGENQENLDRNCNPFNFVETPTYYWRTPDPSYGDTAYAQRFTAVGPETLRAIETLIYDENDGTFGNDNVYITVYGDDGSGFPGIELARDTLLAGTYPSYPAVARADFSHLNLVLIGDYHVAFSTSGQPGLDYENLISSDFITGETRSSGSGDPRMPGWYTMLSWWGVNIHFYFTVYSCRDQFTSCAFTYCHLSMNRRWALPDQSGNFAQAQKFNIGDGECRIDQVILRLNWHSSEAGLPLYSHNSEVNVYDDSAGLPGALLASIVIGPPEYSAVGLTYPIGNRSLVVDFTPFYLAPEGDFWVGIVSLAPDSISGIRMTSDEGGSGCDFGYAQYSDSWEYISESWAYPSDIAGSIRVGYCCIPSTILDVPSFYPTIQLAINAASSGDTVLVQPGTYAERINFKGKRITVGSLFLATGNPNYIQSTVIAGNSDGSTVTFKSSENDSSMLVGFTVRHSNLFYGEGIYCFGTAPKIRHCIISNNVTRGLNCIYASPVIENCEIKSNIAFFGAGMFFSNSTAIVKNTLFADNNGALGGGIYSFDSDLSLENCTIVHNSGDSTGIIHLIGSTIDIANSIVAFNTSRQSTFACEIPNSEFSVSCTNIFGNIGGDWNLCGTALDSGSNNISLNPLYCNAITGDFRLNELSPCAATNSPCGSLIGALDVACTYICGDADGNGALNLNDVAFIQQYYLECDEAPLYFGAGDANCDGKIDLKDVLYLAAHLNATGPPPCCP